VHRPNVDLQRAPRLSSTARVRASLQPASTAPKSRPAPARIRPNRRDQRRRRRPTTTNCSAASSTSTTARPDHRTNPQLTSYVRVLARYSATSVSWPCGVTIRP
jgi:hypothetical protein